MTPETWKIAYLVIGFLLEFALACALGYFGRTKGYPFLLCFTIGLFITPLIGWLIVALPPRAASRSTSPRRNSSWPSSLRTQR